MASVELNREDLELLRLVLCDGIKTFREENESSAIASSNYFEEIVFMERSFKEALHEADSGKITVLLGELQIQFLILLLQEDIEFGGKDADLEVLKSLVYLKKRFNDIRNSSKEFSDIESEDYEEAIY